MSKFYLAATRISTFPQKHEKSYLFSSDRVLISPLSGRRIIRTVAKTR